MAFLASGFHPRLSWTPHATLPSQPLLSPNSGGLCSPFLFSVLYSSCHLLLNFIPALRGLSDLGLWHVYLCIHEKENKDAKISLRYISGIGTFPVAQWLRLPASTSGVMGSIPDQETKTLHASWCGQKVIKIWGKKNMFQAMTTMSSLPPDNSSCRTFQRQN